MREFSSSICTTPIWYPVRDLGLMGIALYISNAPTFIESGPPSENVNLDDDSCGCRECTRCLFHQVIRASDILEIMTTDQGAIQIFCDKFCRLIWEDPQDSVASALGYRLDMLVLINSLIDLNPNNALLLLTKGEEHARRIGERPLALVTMSKALAICPRSVRILCAMSRVHYQMKETSEALRFAKRAMAIDECEKSLCRYADAFAQFRVAGGSKEAVLLYEKVLLANPLAIVPRFQLCEQLCGLRRHAEVVQVASVGLRFAEIMLKANQFVGQTPVHLLASFRRFRAEAIYNLGGREEVIEDATVVIDSGVQASIFITSEAYFLRGMVYFLMGRVSDAFVELQMAEKAAVEVRTARVEPTDVSIPYYRGCILQSMGRFTKAAKCFKLVSQVIPSTLSLERLIVCYERTKQWDLVRATRARLDDLDQRIDSSNHLIDVHEEQFLKSWAPVNSRDSRIEELLSTDHLDAWIQRRSCSVCSKLYVHKLQVCAC